MPYVDQMLICNNDSQNQLALLPMQLKNVSAGRSAPLHGPQGPLTGPAPRTREELIGFSGNSPAFTLIPDIYLIYSSCKLYSSSRSSRASCLTEFHCGCSQTADRQLPQGHFRMMLFSMFDMLRE